MGGGWDDRDCRGIFFELVRKSDSPLPDSEQFISGGFTLVASEEVDTVEFSQAGLNWNDEKNWGPTLSSLRSGGTFQVSLLRKDKNKIQ